MKAFAMGASLATLAAADKPDYAAMWMKFKSDYNKDYSGNGEDEQAKFQVFKQNVDIIEEHNAKKLSYWLGVNEFADLTWEEFSSTHLGYKSSGSSSGLTKVPFPNITDVADSIDWVAKGAVTPVKNQQQCGSCWAFSSTGSLEGAMFVSTGKLISLSEEDLVQCNSITDSGCQGGLMDNAFNWVQQNGICSEAAYPYTSGGGVTGSCKKGCSPVVSITGHTDVPSKDESALKAAVSKQPVSVAIEADKSAFQLYAGGVLDNSACGTNLDHGVLVVGYGTDGKDYWKVKNSWGASWGEQGYIRMVRNKNQCGISQQPSYPTGAKAAATDSKDLEETVQGGTLKITWSDCGDASYHGKVKSLSPNTLAIGQKTTITGSGSTDEQVTGGSFSITAKVGPLSPTYSGEVCTAKTFDLPLGAGSVSWDGVKCPVAVGAVDVAVDVSLSSAIPASLARATITAKATDASGGNLICMSLTTAPSQSIVV
jgi:C1A family cysteine protease